MRRYSLRMSVLLLGEHVARAAYGDDAARLLRIVLDGGADARDVHVDRAVEGLELLALHEVHQRLAREDASGALGERHEEIELERREAALRAVEPHAARVAIDLQPAVAQHARLRRAIGAPQERLQAGEQLARLERLWQIVVGADLEADDAVHRLAARREHEHRQLPARAQPAADLEAVDVRE